MAIGYNDGKHWSELTQLIEQGDVLQFYHTGLGRYAHSAMVVSKDPYTIQEALDLVYVAQHSADYSYRPLSDAFLANGGLANARIRLLKFQSTQF